MIKNQEEDEFVAVRVQDPRIQNEGFWNSYVDYKIFLHTNSKAFTAKTSCVRRRYSEFVWLKKNLQKNSGLVPVPNLPGKSLFCFSNEEFLEKRRKGLQLFLDKVLHMTVCLSDSQLHLFLQTQLPIGHIVDCVQGHTPYTVTDAILTYASSNRGWVQAQEEDDLIQEPSQTPVSYESMESPAPHLPTLPSFKTPGLPPLPASGSEGHVAQVHENIETTESPLNGTHARSPKSYQDESGSGAALAGDRPEGLTVLGYTQGEPAPAGLAQQEGATQLLACLLLTPVEVHSAMDTEEERMAEGKTSPESACFESGSGPERAPVDGDKARSPDAKSIGSVEEDLDQELTDVNIEPRSESGREAYPEEAVASVVDADQAEGQNPARVERHVELTHGAEQEVGLTESNDGGRAAWSSDSCSESDIESIQEEPEGYLHRPSHEEPVGFLHRSLPEEPASTEVSSEGPLDFRTNGEATPDDCLAPVTEAVEADSYIHLPPDLSRSTTGLQSNGCPTTATALRVAKTDQEPKDCYISEKESLKSDWRDNEVSVKQTVAQVTAEAALEKTVAEVHENHEDINAHVKRVQEEEQKQEEEQAEEQEVGEEEEQDEEQDEEQEVGEEHAVKEEEQEEVDEEQLVQQGKEEEEVAGEKDRKSLNTDLAHVANRDT